MFGESFSIVYDHLYYSKLSFYNRMILCYFDVNVFILKTDENIAAKGCFKFSYEF